VRTRLPVAFRRVVEEFSPSDISGLALWLDASQTGDLFQNSDGTVPAVNSGDPVGYWRDRSGNNRHATQATGASRPLVSTAAVGTRSAMAADGANDFLSLGNIASAFPSAGTVFVVCAPSRISPATSWSAFSTGASHWDIYNGNVAYPGVLRSTRLNSVQTIIPYNGAAHQGSTLILRYRSSASAWGGYVNGAVSQIASAAYSAGPTNASAYVIGADISGGTTNGPFKGTICEVIAYSRALTDSECARIERVLAAKWQAALGPSVSNPDAQDWIRRVYLANGTVSDATASAVNALCNDIDAAGIRDRFYRLNLFCGTGLNACLVPLYRGPSLGGTQYGNATDTNVGPFVSGDYVETGASGGLVGNGSSKYLNTGLAPSALPSVATGHMAAYSPQITPVDSTRAFMGCASGSAQYNLSYSLNTGTGLARLRTTWGGTSGHDANEPSGVFRGGLRLSTRTSATALRTYHNSTQVSLFETSVTPVAHTNNWFVFAFNSAGTPIQYSPDSMRAYSIGESMSAEQAAAYYTAMQAFQTALGRNV